ncbi:MAG: hypothetical protein OXI01_04630 [Albidovulum sp.]|nr:hypothetical protein [Albidovulum sp.]
MGGTAIRKAIISPLLCIAPTAPQAHLPTECDTSSVDGIAAWYDAGDQTSQAFDAMFEDWPSMAAVGDGTVELPKSSFRAVLDYAKAQSQRSLIALEVIASTATFLGCIARSSN